jgi:hypothetical protein
MPAPPCDLKRRWIRLVPHDGGAQPDEALDPLGGGVAGVQV